jgi:outer membrane protein TolC
LVYVNAIKTELSKRLEHSKSIAKGYQKKFEMGETNILEYNKAQLNLLNLSKEMESLEIKKEALLAELMSLNGGIPLTFTDSVFQPEVVPADFETWYLLAEQNNPMLNWLKQEIEINRQQEKLNRAMSLPKLNAGYMSEKFAGEQFQGVTVGLAIPLFENKNTVKYAKANSLAIESIKADKKLQFYNQLKALHAKATGLQKNVDGYRADLLKYDNTGLLKKALDKGQISLIEYMLELSIYYESVNRLLEMEREMSRVLAELRRYM